MAHALQERYSKLVDEKLRATLVTKDNLIFNNRYEGDPKAGMVKVQAVFVVAMVIPVVSSSARIDFVSIDSPRE